MTETYEKASETRMKVTSPQPDDIQFVYLSSLKAQRVNVQKKLDLLDIRIAEAIKLGIKEQAETPESE